MYVIEAFNWIAMYIQQWEIKAEETKKFLT